MVKFACVANLEKVPVSTKLSRPHTPAQIGFTEAQYFAF